MNRFLLAIVLFAFFNHAFAQKTSQKKVNETAFVLGVVQTISSVELGEKRTLNIYLPDGYSADSATRYPVIYLLDGSANEDFIHVTGIVQFLTMIGTVPPSIIVGIANVDRRRDFTFPTTIEKDKKDFPTTGHSAKLIAFIEKELQPFIEKRYKVGSAKTLIGQSLGGLLATEILLKKPSLFTHYMIVSPSLWWDSESLLTAAPALIKNHADSATIYISVGNEGKQMEEDAGKLAEVLQAGNKNNSVTLLLLPQENHLTILHNSVYKGFQIFYPAKPALRK